MIPMRGGTSSWWRQSRDAGAGLSALVQPLASRETVGQSGRVDVGSSFSCGGRGTGGGRQCGCTALPPGLWEAHAAAAGEGRGMGGRQAIHTCHPFYPTISWFARSCVGSSGRTACQDHLSPPSLSLCLLPVPPHDSPTSQEAMRCVQITCLPPCLCLRLLPVLPCEPPVSHAVCLDHLPLLRASGSACCLDR